MILYPLNSVFIHIMTARRGGCDTLFDQGAAVRRPPGRFVLTQVSEGHRDQSAADGWRKGRTAAIATRILERQSDRTVPAHGVTEQSLPIQIQIEVLVEHRRQRPHARHSIVAGPGPSGRSSAHSRACRRRFQISNLMAEAEGRAAGEGDHRPRLRAPTPGRAHSPDDLNSSNSIRPYVRAASMLLPSRRFPA